MTRSDTLDRFVAEYAVQAGFTRGYTERAAHLDMTHVYLDDDVVGEHVTFTVTDRDLIGHTSADVMRLLAYQIDRARRELVFRVIGEAAP